MLHNMTGRSFSPIKQPGLLFILIPILVIVVGGLDGEAEKWFIRTLTLLAFGSFYLRMGCLGRQYCDYANRKFFLRETEKVDKSN